MAASPQQPLWLITVKSTLPTIPFNRRHSVSTRNMHR